MRSREQFAQGLPTANPFAVVLASGACFLLFIKSLSAWNGQLNYLPSATTSYSSSSAISTILQSRKTPVSGSHFDPLHHVKQPWSPSQRPSARHALIQTTDPELASLWAIVGVGVLSFVAVLLGAQHRLSSQRETPAIKPVLQTLQDHEPVQSGLGATARRELLLSGLALASAASLSCKATAVSTEALSVAGMRRAIWNAFDAAIPKARYPVVLRLTFHDAGTYDAASGTGGANASVQFELDRPESRGLKRGLSVIKDAKDRLKGSVAQDVSFADLIYLAGVYVVEKAGGPQIIIPLGRIDATQPDPPNRLPAETLTGPELRKHFARSGFTAQELVLLSGAHTLGSKGFGDPYVFDNTYYKTLLERPWLNKSLSKDDFEMAQHTGLPSDKALPEDAECLRWIEVYAADQDRFFADFAQAYLKLSTVGTSLSV